MHALDWYFIISILLGLLGVALYTKKHMRGVADFLSGGRMASRYLLAVAKGEQGVGAVVFVGLFEIIRNSGFVVTWWQWLSAPILFLVGVSGWVIYRFRETRALTLGQFFEIRYSKSFRIFAGITGFLAGLLNFGIIPVVGARFLSYFLGLPPTFTLWGWHVDTYIPLMALLLTISLVLTFSGGLITLMVTNCIEGMLSQILFIIIIVALLCVFSWQEISQTLETRPPGHSLLNPFDSLELKDFGIAFVLIQIWWGIYRTMAWQNQSPYSTAAITAHESRMGVIMGNWRSMGNTAVITLLAVCAMTFLSHPDFTAQSAMAKETIAGISPAKIQQQMTVPVAIEHMLPIGIKGLLCIILLMGVFGGDGTHMLSWGSIFIQDVVVPLRKKPFTPEQHIRLLRWSMTGVAVFAFVFGCVVRQTEYVFMWWVVTEALFVGGAGAVIIGGLYWKKGTTAGAWAGLLTGSVLITGGILCRQIYGDAFPLNGQWISLYGSILAILVYAVVSFLTCKQDFDMDRMLHRGKYAVASEKQFETKSKGPVRWSRYIGFDEHFTVGDKWLAGGLLGWSFLWFGVLVVGSIWNWVAPWPLSAWSYFWFIVGIGIPIAFTVITAVWFSWGGIRDMIAFFRRLRAERVDALDNGMVVDHHNLDEVAK